MGKVASGERSSSGWRESVWVWRYSEGWKFSWAGHSGRRGAGEGGVF